MSNPLGVELLLTVSSAVFVIFVIPILLIWAVAIFIGVLVRRHNQKRQAVNQPNERITSHAPGESAKPTAALGHSPQPITAWQLVAIIVLVSLLPAIVEIVILIAAVVHG